MWHCCGDGLMAWGEVASSTFIAGGRGWVGAHIYKWEGLGEGSLAPAPI